MGADDYLAKLFAYEELHVHISALGRRACPALPLVIERASITLDTARRQAFRDSRYLALSCKEFRVLEVLMRAEGAASASTR